MNGKLKEKNKPVYKVNDFVYITYEDDCDYEISQFYGYIQKIEDGIYYVECHYGDRGIQAYLDKPFVLTVNESQILPAKKVLEETIKDIKEELTSTKRLLKLCK